MAQPSDRDEEYKTHVFDLSDDMDAGHQTQAPSLCSHS